MKERRQTSIGVRPREKVRLENAKKAYEKSTGGDTDWGTFLIGAAALALVGLGVYGLAKASRERPTSECPYCKERFSIAYAEGLPSIGYITCPNPRCGKEMVVDFSA